MYSTICILRENETTSDMENQILPLSPAKSETEMAEGIVAVEKPFDM